MNKHIKAVLTRAGVRGALVEPLFGRGPGPLSDITGGVGGAAPNPPVLRRCGY
jgi:hypothetical protein